MSSYIVLFPNMFIDLECMDATEFAKGIPDGTVDLYILDPPFGIGEDKFAGGGSYNTNVMGEYMSAPEDYHSFAKGWLLEVYRTLKPTGTVCLVLGWGYQLADAMVAARDVGFGLVNHVIWHYNTQVIPTKKKMSSSHYHILILTKDGNSQAFNVPSNQDIEDFYSDMDMNPIPDGRDGTVRYYDMMDVWRVRKTANKNKKNLNCLPDALVRKMIRYYSHPGNIVCDLFMGNFTTAKVANEEGRSVMGCDANPGVCDHWIPILENGMNKYKPRS